MNHLNRYKVIILPFFISVFLFLFLTIPVNIKAKESSCISCHTSAKKLIEITREIEASKPKVEAVESEGEG